MVKFISENWANILLIIVGSFALATYILQERKKKIDAASLIVLQIDEFQERLREISTFIVDGQLNETAFYESLPLMDTDYWNKYKHYFVRKMDATSYTALNQLYEYVSEIQEQQMLMKAFQKNRYVNEHGNTLAIYKLTHNIPLAMGDYQELERVLTSELGSKEDYAREFGDTPFGLLIRKIAKLDHEAAMQAFSAFINDQSLNQKQIAFVNKIINHIELNGYMENVAELTKPPFDKPISFIKLFDAKTRTALMETINQVRENAVQITAS